MKGNWDIFLNLAVIFLNWSWDWFTGESEIEYPG